MTIDRRAFLAGMAGAGGTRALMKLGLATSLGLSAARGFAQDAAALANGTRLVLLGTQGGPNFRVERKECANAVVIDGRSYIVDCGYGALGRLGEAGINFREVANIFLTHLHDDHTSDVAALLSHQWTGGRIDETLVVGPYGTENLVAAAIEYFRANTEIRLADEDRSVLPAEIFSGRDIEATDAPTEIFADDRVTVSSVENTHFPDSARQAVPYRAVSYRFDSRDRSITISGDTAYSENLVRLAEGSDVFACEVIEAGTTRANFEARVAAGAYADNPEGIWKHIIETHTSTEEAGRMAAEAGVGTLVLTHLLPGALMDVPDETYLEGIRKHFDGPVIIGRDLMVI
ncbi:MAG: MBL fold metallo-hydrolase [Gammaproteobacteria bacterium]|jgi:ribonuclease BN (tRNA processing enzyme)